MVKNLSANAVVIIDASSILGLGRSSGGGRGNLLQYPCLVNPVDIKAWQSISMESQRVRHNSQSEHKKQQGAEEGTILSFLPFIPGKNQNTQICSRIKNIAICLVTVLKQKENDDQEEVTSVRVTFKLWPRKFQEILGAFLWDRNWGTKGTQGLFRRLRTCHLL